MEPKLKEQLIEAANFLRYLGKYNESNAIINLSVICEIRGVTSCTELAEWRSQTEKNLTP